MHRPYHYQCMVPFHLADPAGILFFGHAFTLFHQAFEHFVVHQLKYPWTSWFQNEEWFVPIRHAEAQYLHPIHAGQESQINLSVQSLSASSFTVLSSIHQKALCCSLKTVHVFCNHHTKQKIPIPEPLIAVLTHSTMMEEKND